MNFYTRLYPVVLLLFLFLFSNCKSDDDALPDPPENPIDSMVFVPDPLPEFIMQAVTFEKSYDHALVIEMAKDGNPVILALNGIFRSEDDGKNWTQVKSLFNDNVSDLVKAPNEDLYVVIKNKGIFKSIDDGKSWAIQNISNIDFTAPFNTYKLVAAQDNDVFLLQFRHLSDLPHLYHSSDGGATFTERTNLPDFGGEHNVMEFEAASDGSVLWATGGGFFKTEDDGQSWTQIADFTDVRDLFVTPDGLAFFRRAMSSVTLKGMDDGADWTTMSRYGNVIGYNADGHLVFSGWLNDNKEVFRSTDNGETWLAYGFQENQLDDIVGNSTITLSIGAGRMYFNHPWDVIWGSFKLPTGAIRDMLFYKGRWIVATSSSIHISENSGKTWERSYHFSTGSVNRLAIRKTDDKILAGSLNGEATLYLLDKNVSVIEEQVKFGVSAIVTGLTQDEEGRTMIGLGGRDHDGITFLQTGWGNSWVEQTFPHPTPYAYVHDFHYNGKGIAYAAFEHEFGKTGISFFLMQQTTGGAVSSKWDIENGYQLNQMILKTFTLRNADGSNLFVGVDNVNRIWYSRGGQWALYGETNIGEIYKIRFDDSGYLYLMSAQGMTKTNIPLN